MLGALIGDIVGSPYEGKGRKIKTKDFRLFGPYSRFTDDTVCTAAVADILMHDKPPAQTMQRWCRQYPRPRLRRQLRQVDLFVRPGAVQKLGQRIGDARLSGGIFEQGQPIERA